jgi:hypothetical protein
MGEVESPRAGSVPVGVLSGGVFRFFCAEWSIVAETCLGSGELAGFYARWWGAAESPITGSVPVECFWAGVCVFLRGMVACRGNMLVFW